MCSCFGNIEISDSAYFNFRDIILFKISEILDFSKIEESKIL